MNSTPFSPLCFGIVLVLSLFAIQAKGQGPDVVPPDFLTTDHSDDWEPGQLLFRQVGLDRQSIVAYHNGVIYSGGYAGRPFHAFEWTDRTDAFSLTRTVAAGEVNFGIRSTQGTHGHGGKMGDWLLGALRRTATPGVNTVVSQPDDDALNFGDQRPPENGERFHDIYWPWRLPFSWAQYETETGWGWGYRHDRFLGEWDSTGETGIVGHVLMMGNLLFICSDETFSGVAVYDMAPALETPPRPPTLLDKLSGRIGAYLPAIWENYIVFASDGEITLVDYSDPENLTLAGTYPVNRIPGQDYIQFQDKHGFYHGNKVNMETGVVELQFENYDDSLRPPGSVSGNLNTSQYLLPLGNLLVTGGRGTTGEDGVGLWVHQDAPDTRRPEVGYHIPRPNQTNYPTGAPISLAIHETLEGFTAVNGETVIVRRSDSTAPVDCWVTFSHDDILTITPKEFLEEDVEYVVEIVDGGIKDASGNGIIGHTFHFSTGASVVGGNLAPEVTAVDFSETPGTPGSPLTLNIAANDPEDTAVLEYRYTTSDGTPSTDWMAENPTFSHTYADAGHYEVKIQVREQENPSLKTTRIVTVTVSDLIAEGPRPTKSSPISLDSENGKVWVVNPDNDSVSRIDSTTREIDFEIDLAGLLAAEGSIDPRSIAIGSDGNVWVACRDADALAVLDGETGTLISEVGFGYGSAPISVASSADGESIFLVTECRGHEADTLGGNDPGNGQIIRFDASTRTRTGSLELGPFPRATAVFGDADRVLVTRFISGHARGGEVWDIDASSPSALTMNGTIFLPPETEEDTPSNGTGIANYVAGITISPDERTAWYTATKPTDGHGALFGEPLEFANSMRSMIGRIDLTGPQPEDVNFSRIDFDNTDSPTAIEFSPAGDWAFVAAQGNQLIGVFDRILIENAPANSSRNTRARIPTGAAPQGMILDPETGLLWVKNFMDRSVTIHEMNSFLQSGQVNYSSEEIETVATEKLAVGIFTGKQIFYNASDTGGLANRNRMSDEGYISCASCHADGMHDGRTWDFTQRGEGLRNTTDLRGRGGLAHGNVHWTANFDEIQDFENDIRHGFGGHGFMDEAQFAATSDPLGTAKAGISAELDALAAYVSSLGKDTFPKSPYRTTEGDLTVEAMSGAALFTAENCAECHDPDQHFTDSASGDGLAGLHDVGTARASSGLRLGDALPGIDTPTLLGIWNTAPYFHNGSATALEEVFAVAGGNEYQAEDGTLQGTADIRNVFQSNSVSGAQGGQAVRIGREDSGVEWSGIDGGSGGEARLEFVYAADQADAVEIRINGEDAVVLTLEETQDSRLDAAHWRKGIVVANLDPSEENTVQFLSLTRVMKWVDHLHVATADDFAAATAHTRVAALTEGEQSDLIDFLKQLDGESDAEPVVDGDLTFSTWQESIAWPPGSDTGPDGDVDDDGRSNFREYADSSDPLDPDSGSVTTGEYSSDGGSGEWLSIEFRRNRLATDLDYVVQRSSDLENWTASLTDGVDVIEEIIDPDPGGDGGAELVRIRVRTDGLLRHFLRLSVQAID